MPGLVSTGVPDVAVVSKGVVHIDLAEGAQRWADLAIDLACGSQAVDRSRGVEEVRASGFGIEESAKWLDGFYRSLASGEDASVKPAVR